MTHLHNLNELCIFRTSIFLHDFCNLVLHLHFYMHNFKGMSTNINHAKHFYDYYIAKNLHFLYFAKFLDSILVQFLNFIKAKYKMQNTKHNGRKRMTQKEGFACGLWCGNETIKCITKTSIASYYTFNSNSYEERVDNLGAKMLVFSPLNI